MTPSRTTGASPAAQRVGLDNDGAVTPPALLDARDPYGRRSMAVEAILEGDRGALF
jgi:hypothetical protein